MSAICHSPVITLEIDRSGARSNLARWQSFGWQGGEARVQIHSRPAERTHLAPVQGRAGGHDGCPQPGGAEVPSGGRSRQVLYRVDQQKTGQHEDAGSPKPAGADAKGAPSPRARAPGCAPAASTQRRPSQGSSPASTSRECPRQERSPRPGGCREFRAWPSRRWQQSPRGACGIAGARRPPGPENPVSGPREHQPRHPSSMGGKSLASATAAAETITTVQNGGSR